MNVINLISLGMEIKPPHTISGITPKDSSLPAVPVEAIRIPANWQVGKLFEILISRLVGQQLFFELNGTAAHAEKPEGLQIVPGDRLLLQLVQTTPQPELKIIRHITSPQSATIIDRAVQQLTAKLPPSQRADIQQLFSMLSKIAMTPINNQQGLSPVIIREAREFVSTIPSAIQLRDVPSLRKHIQQSGVFTEQQLLSMVSGKESPPGDLRLQLYRLAEKVRHAIALSSQPLPARQADHTDAPLISTVFSKPETAAQPQAGKYVAAERETPHHQVDNEVLPEILDEQLLDKIDKTILRQQVQQLLHAQAEQAGKTQLVVDLPVKDQQKIDVFELQVEKDSRNNNESDSAGTLQWRVTIGFEFAGFGHVSAKLWLHDRQLSTRFEIKRQHAREAFNRELHTLEEKLKAKGFTETRLIVTPEVTTNHDLNRQYELE